MPGYDRFWLDHGTMANAERQSRQRRDRQIHSRRRPRSIWGAFLQTCGARRFDGVEPGSRARGKHATGRSRPKMRGVS